jgi:hypothetical protein
MSNMYFQIKGAYAPTCQNITPSSTCSIVLIVVKWDRVVPRVVHYMRLVLMIMVWTCRTFFFLPKAYLTFLMY